ncbi:hypothetical protein GCM10028832_27440 [Streptomyces sparsus]
MRNTIRWLLDRVALVLFRPPARPCRGPVSRAASTPAGIGAVPPPAPGAPSRWLPAPRSPYSERQLPFFVDNLPVVRPYFTEYEQRTLRQLRVTETCCLDLDGCGHGNAT